MQETFTLVGIWEAMSWVGRSVALILALMSIYSIGLAIERAWRFRLARRESVDVATRITPLLEQHRLDEALSVTTSKDYRHSHVARVIGAGLEKYRADQGQWNGDYDLVESGRRAIEREALMTTADMKRGLSNLATISTTAPFIGLFGTVVGIITAFRGMAMTGSGGLGAVSAGIAEALVATAFGLFVAIPAVWLYNYFLSKIERFQVEMNNAASELLDFFIQSEAKKSRQSSRVSHQPTAV